MNNDTNNAAHPLRSILKRMERSIDDARHRRTSGPETPGEPGEALRPVVPTVLSRGVGENTLDTPIVSTKSAGTRAPSTGPVRDERTMFDFNGPRLKARPKRRSAS